MKKVLLVVLFSSICGFCLAQDASQIAALQQSITDNTAQIASDQYQINQDQADIVLRQNDVNKMNNYIQQAQMFLQAMSAQQTAGINWSSNSLN